MKLLKKKQNFFQIFETSLIQKYMCLSRVKVIAFFIFNLTNQVKKRDSALNLIKEILCGNRRSSAWYVTSTQQEDYQHKLKANLVKLNIKSYISGQSYQNHINK
ncbi:hypothetical protein J6590_099742 [Homalodisca vitripennis]|nr:hypothetical protein J6590_099742 [Homalodisca vitripennis]